MSDLITRNQVSVRCFKSTNNHFYTFARGLINKTPNVCGGDACIGNTRIPIWSLVNDKKLGMSDGDILAAFPQISAMDLVNAWAYYAANSEEIEAAIRENKL